MRREQERLDFAPEIVAHVAFGFRNHQDGLLNRQVQHDGDFVTERHAGVKLKRRLA